MTHTMLKRERSMGYEGDTKGHIKRGFEKSIVNRIFQKKKRRNFK